VKAEHRFAARACGALLFVIHTKLITELDATEIFTDQRSFSPTSRKQAEYDALAIEDLQL